MGLRKARLSTVLQTEADGGPLQTAMHHVRGRPDARASAMPSEELVVTDNLIELCGGRPLLAAHQGPGVGHARVRLGCSCWNSIEVTHFPDSAAEENAGSFLPLSSGSGTHPGLEDFGHQLRNLAG